MRNQENAIIEWFMILMMRITYRNNNYDTKFYYNSDVLLLNANSDF